MKIAYLDCYSGISGDMTLSALLDAGASIDKVQQVIESMGLPSVRLSSSPTTRKGFRGQLLNIAHPPESVHRGLLDIAALIRRGSMAAEAKELALRLFERLARAEAKVHSTSIDRVIFHEVGAIDSIVDIVGVAVAWIDLEIEKGVASPVPTGSGSMKMAHGVVSIPAPATAELLQGTPLAPCGLPFEMTTPTGAAILSELVTEYGPMPAMQVNRIGYGAGQREVPDRPNLLRVLVGHSLDIPSRPKSEPNNTQHDDSDTVWVLETNLDDISAEEIGFAIEMLWHHGALDVFTTAIQMKKNRPGTMLTVLCHRADRKAIESILLEHTGTLGIRMQKQARVVLPRARTEVETPWGIVSGKVSMLPTGEVDFSPEYEDCRWIAKEHGLRLKEVIREANDAYQNSESPRRSQSAKLESPEESELPIDHSDVNLAFQQAAVEDREEFFGERSSNTLQILWRDEASPQSELSSPTTSETESSIEDETFYRWDSAPWRP